MFSSLRSDNTQTVLFFTICVFIGNAQAKSDNSTINTTGNETAGNRRSNLLYQVRLPLEDAKKVQKALRLSDNQSKKFLHENKPLQLNVPEQFITLEAFKHALIKRVSEYTVQASAKTIKLKSRFKTTKRTVRQKVTDKKRHVQPGKKPINRNRNGKKPVRPHNTLNKTVSKYKLRAKGDKNHRNTSNIGVKTRNGKTKRTSKRAKMPGSNKRNNSTKGLKVSRMHIKRRTTTKSDKKKEKQRKFKSIYSGRSRTTQGSKKKVAVKSNSTIKPKPSIGSKAVTRKGHLSTTKSAVNTSTINKVATDLEESSTTAVAANKPVEESTAVEETTMAESASVKVSSTVGESTPVEESTPKEESSITTVEETTPEESTTEETTKATTTLRLPLARPLVFMGPKEN